MRYFAIALWSCLIGISALAQASQGAPVGDKSNTTKVDEVFARFDKPESPGCALAVIKDSRIIYQRGYGMSNLEYGIPISPSWIFHIASISKEFTAMAIQL
jgi:CubicO group peptidase (beta-lactamase class C family)